MFAEAAAPPPSRPAQRAAREAAILGAALRIFAERGYGGARIEDIADAAGIGKGTLYVYFSSKRALLEGVVRAAADPGLAAIESIATQAEGEPAAVVRVIVERAKRALRNEIAPVFAKVLVAEGGRAPDVSAVYRKDVMEPLLAVIADVIGRGIQRSVFRPIDPSLAARLLLAPAIAAAISLEVFGPGDAGFDPDSLLDTHADLFLAGLQSV